MANTPTTNFGILKPAAGDINWDDEYAAFADLVDSRLMLGGMKNAIINGDFNIWQRGTSFTANGYTADRWTSSIGSGGSPAATISRQAHTIGQTAVPGEPEFFLRHDQTAAATTTQPSEVQKIEEVRLFAGQQITLSFYAKASKSITASTQLVEDFGSGGSAAVASSLVNHSVTTSWQKFTRTLTLASISGKTIGAGNFLQLTILLPANDIYQFDVSHAQIEKGSVATDFERRSIAVEERLAQRYYEAGDRHIVTTRSASTTQLGVNFHYKVRKRVAPTFTMTFQSGNRVGIGGVTLSNTLTSPVSTVDGIQGETTGDGSTIGQYTAHYKYTADAEL